MELGNTLGINETFVTLHALAREFDVPERQVRYRFRTLKTEGKLVEGADFIKDDFVDEFHFAYKINPVRFMQEAKLNVAPPPASNIGTEDQDSASKLLPSEEDIGNTDQPHNEEVGNREPDIGNSLGNRETESASEVDTNPEGIGTRVDDKDISLDYIDTLKEQMRVKDAQIADYRNQVAEQTDLTKRTIGELIKAQNQIQLLVPGRVEEPEIIQQNEEVVAAEQVESEEGPGQSRAGNDG